MSIKTIRKKRGFLSCAVLTVFLVVFAACSSGGGGGPDPDGGVAIVTINGEPFTINSKLLICALTEIVVDWAPNDNQTITEVTIELVSDPTASTSSGFLDAGADYDDAPLTFEVIPIAPGTTSITRLFKADVPDDSGDYVVNITVSAGTFDYPTFAVTIPTDDNPCLQSFYDRGIDGGDVAGNEEGYAADAPPVAVPGEIVRITGYNISANPDEFFLIDDGATEYSITGLSHISGPNANGLVTIDGRLGAGCGQLDDLGVRNDAKGYPHPITDTAIDESAQTLEDVYTYTPVITQISPDLGTCEGSTAVTISGGGFLDGATATIDGNDVTIDTVACNQITGTTPAGCGENLEVIVTNPDGNGGDSYSAHLFDYTPEVLAVTPDYGPEAGGTDIEITGCGFLEGATVTINGDPIPEVATTEVVDCETINTTTPRSKDDDPDGDIPVPVVVQNPSGYSDSEDLYIYRPRNIDEDTNYTDVSLLGDYNWIAIAHRFGENGEMPMPVAQADSDYDVFVTSLGSDFNPAFAPIDGGSATFNGDGTFDISAGADEFYVVDDGDPSLANVDVSASDAGVYDMEVGPRDESPLFDGSLFIGDDKTGALAPDGNSLFVASTIYQMGTISQMYIFTRQPEFEPGEEPVPVDLNGKTMGMVAFVHDYGSDFWWFEELFHTYRGIVSFGTSTFVLTAMEHKVIEDYGEGIDGEWVEVDDSSGRYTADTSGLFSMQFDPANFMFGVDLFDSDEVFGIFTVTDNPDPADAQLFAGVNLAQPPVSPEPWWDFAKTAAVPSPTGTGRSMLLLMVPLGPEDSQDAESFADQLEGDVGWAKGVFSHIFVEDDVDFSLYWTFNGLSFYDPYDPYEGDTGIVMLEGLWISSFFWEDGDGEFLGEFGYELEEPGDGRYSLFDGPFIAGFISEDDSVNVRVDLGEYPFSSISLELEK